MLSGARALILYADGCPRSQGTAPPTPALDRVVSEGISGWLALRRPAGCRRSRAAALGQILGVMPTQIAAAGGDMAEVRGFETGEEQKTLRDRYGGLEVRIVSDCAEAFGLSALGVVCEPAHAEGPDAATQLAAQVRACYEDRARPAHLVVLHLHSCGDAARHANALRALDSVAAEIWGGRQHRRVAGRGARGGRGRGRRPAACARRAGERPADCQQRRGRAAPRAEQRDAQRSAARRRGRRAGAARGVRPAPPAPSLPYKVDTSRPSLRTNWTRLVPFPQVYGLYHPRYSRCDTLEALDPAAMAVRGAHPAPPRGALACAGPPRSPSADVQAAGVGRRQRRGRWRSICWGSWPSCSARCPSTAPDAAPRAASERRGRKAGNGIVQHFFIPRQRSSFTFTHTAPATGPVGASAAGWRAARNASRAPAPAPSTIPAKKARAASRGLCAPVGAPVRLRAPGPLPMSLNCARISSAARSAAAGLGARARARVSSVCGSRHERQAVASGKEGRRVACAWGGGQVSASMGSGSGGAGAAVTCRRSGGAGQAACRRDHPARLRRRRAR